MKTPKAIDLTDCQETTRNYITKKGKQQATIHNKTAWHGYQVAQSEVLTGLGLMNAYAFFTKNYKQTELELLATHGYEAALDHAIARSTPAPSYMEYIFNLISLPHKSYVAFYLDQAELRLKKELVLLNQLPNKTFAQHDYITTP